jgi:hypothetical protein
MNVSLLTFGRIVQFCEHANREIDYVNLDDMSYLSLRHGLKGKKFCDVLSDNGTTMIVQYGQIKIRIISEKWKTLEGTRMTFHLHECSGDEFITTGPIVKLK